jgi:hypothetical protein
MQIIVKNVDFATSKSVRHAFVYGEVVAGKAAVRISAAMGNHPGVRILPSPPKLHVVVVYVGSKVC